MEYFGMMQFAMILLRLARDKLFNSRGISYKQFARA